MICCIINQIICLYRYLLRKAIEKILIVEFEYSLGRLIYTTTKVWDQNNILFKRC